MNQGLNTTPDDYEIVFAFPMTIQLNGILPIINNSSNPVTITIGNSGSTPTVTIDGNSGAYSGFFIPMGNVTIQNMIGFYYGRNPRRMQQECCSTRECMAHAQLAIYR